MDLSSYQNTTSGRIQSWKTEVLSTWASNTDRVASIQDLISFSTVLDVSSDVVQSWLEQVRADDNAGQATSTKEAPSGSDRDVFLPVNDLKGKGRAIFPKTLISSSWSLEPETTQITDSNCSLSTIDFTSKGVISQNFGGHQNHNPGGDSDSDSNFGTAHYPTVGEPSTANQHSSTTYPLLNPVALDLEQVWLRDHITKDIHVRKSRGCGIFDRTTASQRGDVPCTLGCSRVFRSTCDRNRHEETVYPQTYWICYLCINFGDISSKDLFIRLDKIRAHSSKHHSGQLNLNLCTVQTIQTLYPKNCGICQHQFWSQKDRSHHIAKHHSGSRRGNHRGDGIASTTSLVTSEASPPAMSDSSILSSIILRPLKDNTNLDIDPSDSRSLTIRWLEATSHQGATSLVRKVRIAHDPTFSQSAGTNIFAVKTIQAPARHYFDQEAKMFAQLQQLDSRPAVIKCYGTFEDYDAEGELTYNLLLEHAQGNLWQHWASAAPPDTFSGIADTYSQYSGIAASLESIHEKRLYGRHGDIKPENILWYTSASGKGVLVIADLGLSRIHETKTAGSSTWQASGGTPAYCAPELNDSMTVTGSVPALQSTDIWSFGCLLSLAATWLTTGFQGVQRYEKQRQCAIDLARGINSAAFHDGEKVLTAVFEWHNHLRNCVRPADTITALILDLIEQRLLVFDRSLRPAASEVHGLLERILRGAREDKQDQRRELADVEEPCHIGALSGEYLPSIVDLHGEPVPDLFDGLCDFRDSAIGMGIFDTDDPSDWDDETLLHAKMIQDHSTP